MLDRLKRWFGSSSREAGPTLNISRSELNRRLARLDAEIEAADPGMEGIPLNRAGDLCGRAGDTERALGYLGRAIDSYLEDDQPEAARAVAKRLLRLHPRAIRTLCTITWLDLAGGYLGDALLHLGEYVEAARRGDRQEICRDQIVKMATIMADEQFRRTAGEGLEDLGYPEDAATVREWASAEDAPEGVDDSSELRSRCFAEAVGANEGDGR